MKLVDLSQPLYDSPPTWPGFPEVKIRRIIHHSKDEVCAKEITTCTHASTHIDAPWHFMGGKYTTVDKIPLEKLYGSAVILDITKENLGEITAEDLEKASPAVEEGDIVIVHTGWHHDEIWNDETRYMILFPGFVKSAVDWLIDKKVKMVGSDIPCVDHPYQTPLSNLRPDLLKGFDKEKYPHFVAHYGFLGNDIPILELLGGDIDKVLERRLNIAAFPLKIVGGDASPVRVVAFLEE